MTSRKIFQWGVSPIDPYDAPEIAKYRIVGIADFEGSDRWIQTSSVVGKRDGCVVTKSGSLYSLESVNPEYERLYPDAKNRLFNSLQEVPYE